MIICEANYSLGYRTAEVRKSWFNREGELMKVTGESKVIERVDKNGEIIEDGDQNEMSVNTGNSPPRTEQKP
jgi:hypothetical protein